MMMIQSANSLPILAPDGIIAAAVKVQHILIKEIFEEISQHILKKRLNKVFFLIQKLEDILW